MKKEVSREDGYCEHCVAYVGAENLREYEIVGQGTIWLCKDCYEDYDEDAEIRPKSTKKAKNMKKEEKIPIKDDDVVEIEEEDGKKVVEIESKEDHKEEVASGDEKDSDNLNAGKKKSTKKSKVKKGYEVVTVGQLTDKLQDVIDELSDYDREDKLRVVTNTYFIHSQYFMQFGGAGFIDLYNIEIEEYADDEFDEDDDDIEESARKSINNTNTGRDSMRYIKKNTLLKELKDIDDECEGKDCEDKKEVSFRRATRKDEEPDSKKPLQEELSEDELREKCARAKKRYLARNARKGVRKAESATPEVNEFDEVADPEELVSGGDGAEPKGSVVDEVEDPEGHDDETHGEEPEGNVVLENADPKEIDKIRRAKIRRALAKRRMQKAREAPARKMPVRRGVRKFSVATRGSERYNGRENYNQSPMMRQAIDNAFPREDETVKALNARLDKLRAQSRNRVTNPIGKKRLH